MSYFGLSSASAVSALFDTTSSTYSILKASSEYSSYRTLNSVVSSLKGNIATCSSDEAKADLQDRLDTILETIKSAAPAATSSLSLSEQAEEQANELLSSYGLGTSIDTLA